MTDRPNDPAAPGEPARAPEGPQSQALSYGWLIITLLILALGAAVSAALGYVLLVITRGYLFQMPRFMVLAAAPAALAIIAAFFTGRRFIGASRAARIPSFLPVLYVAGAAALLVVGSNAWIKTTALPRLAPQRVVGGHSFTALSLSDHWSCGLTPAGLVYCWGLWFGDRPTLVAPDLALVSLVSTGGHSCGLDASGATYCFSDSQWRRGAYPTAASMQVSDTLVLASLSLGELGLCGVTPSGAAYCERDVGASTMYGSGSCVAVGDGGLCEDGSGPDDPAPEAGIGAAGFHQVGGTRRFAELAVGDKHICGRTLTDEILCWGPYRWQVEGGGTLANLSKPPRRFGAGMRLTSLRAGTGNTCALTTDGAAWCEGTFDRDAYITALQNTLALDLGERGPSDTMRVRAPGGVPFTAVRTRGFRGCALAADSLVYCWGADDAAAASEAPAYSRAPVPVAGGRRFTEVAMGERHTCALTREGAAWCWGMNGSRQLGRRRLPW